MQRFDLILFDFDGTLSDSESVLVDLVNEALTDRGHEAVDAARIAARIGLPLERVMHEIAPHLDAAEIAAICAGYRTRAREPETVQRFVLFPGVREALFALRDQGVRLAITTSKNRSTTVDIVAHCGITDVIEAIFGGDSVTRGKPHPEMVETALAHFGCAPERTLLVGDTSFDIEMGQAAGVSTCAVAWGMQPAEALRQLAPDFVIDRIGELVEFQKPAIPVNP
jgi:phosphoglycolate phosphatase